MAQFTPMIQQYLSIKADYPDAFLFFRLGDFYELFFEDAERAAEELEITLTGREGGQGKKIPMCGVPHHSSQIYIKKLIDKGYKVAICEQMEDPASAKGVIEREVVQMITPGTFFDDHFLKEKENNFLMVVHQQENAFVLAVADITTGECSTCLYSGNEKSLIQEILCCQPKEVLLAPSLRDLEKIRNQLSKKSHLTVTALLWSEVPSMEDAESQLKEFSLDFDSISSSPLLLQGVAILFNYLKKTQKRLLLHMKRIQNQDSTSHMVLDFAARTNLEITQSLKEKKKQGSLYGFLDRTATAMGSRLLKKWLDKPLLDKAAIEERQAKVQALLDDLLLFDEVRSYLKKVYDLERLCARVAYGSANARDLLALYSSLSVIPFLNQLLLETHCSVWDEVARNLDPCQEVMERIQKALLENPPVSVKEGGFIKEGYHPQLDQLRETQKEGRLWIARLEETERKETGIRSLKVGYNRVFGYFIEVTKANLKSIPEGRYLRKQTLANAERFITPALKEKEKEILEAEEKAVELEYSIFCELKGFVLQHIFRIQQLANQIAQLDVLQAFTSVSQSYHYVKPSILIDQQLKIIEGRHPVVEASLTDNKFIANDLAMDEQRRIFVITGPNMAGKSTYMRQTAIIAILAQIGCFVPAKEAQIGLIDRIFTRIGAADDLVGGRSTFMVEMDETSQALFQASRRSLILLDEIGRGTSTYDGMALAHSIMEYLHHVVQAKTLFSTHYHELTTLANTLPHVVNVYATCKEYKGELLFLHRIEEGKADKSYGIHVAKLAGMPTGVIERAKELLQALETKSGILEREISASQQLDLFEVPQLPSVEAEVIRLLYEWELWNRTPMESLQFLNSLLQKLKEHPKGVGR